MIPDRRIEEPPILRDAIGYADDQFIHLEPSIDFTEQKEFRRDTQAAEMIDYFARHFGAKTS